MSTAKSTKFDPLGQSGVTYDALQNEAFDATVKQVCKGGNPPVKEFVAALVANTRKLVAANNSMMKLDSAVPYMPLPKTITPMLVARCIAHYHSVAVIEGEGDTVMLGIYVADARRTDYGTYVTDEKRIRAIAREFNASLTKKEAKEVVAYLIDTAPRRQVTTERDLLPMNDGVFDYRTKQTMPFSPEYIYLRKYPVEIPDHPIGEPVITMPDGKPWTFTSWLAEVIEDEKTREVVWDVIGALLRPHVNWLRISFLIGSGRNGKGTLIELMRALVGRKNCAALSLKHFSKQTELVPLLGALANIADENDDSFIPTSELVKAIADHNAITIRKLYNDPFTFRPHMLNVQAMNELPVFKDKSDGMHSRILAISFEKQFLRGENDNTDIKEKYMVDPKVVQWVAYHALVERPDYYVLGSSSATDAALVNYRVETDPVAAFWADEARENVIGCFLPYSFLHAWYTRWLRESNPSGHPVERKKFTRRIKELAAADGWVDSGSKRSCRAWMIGGEPHAEKYAKRRYDGTGCRQAYDESDQLARWYTYTQPAEDRGLVLGCVEDWCAQHGVKPREFVENHAKQVDRYVHNRVTANMLGKFVGEVKSETIDFDTASYECDHARQRVF